MRAAIIAGAYATAVAQSTVRVDVDPAIIGNVVSPRVFGVNGNIGTVTW